MKNRMGASGGECNSHESEAAEEDAKVPEAQREKIMKFTQYAMEGAFAASPVLMLIVAASICSNDCGGRSILSSAEGQFARCFAVWMYASLPGIIENCWARS